MPNEYIELEKDIDDHGGGAGPVSVFTLETWGGGNYFLSDDVTGKCIRLTSSTYWKLIDELHELVKQSLINGG